MASVIGWILGLNRFVKTMVIKTVMNNQQRDVALFVFLNER
jgi:hypothetical protein